MLLGNFEMLVVLSLLLVTLAVVLKYTED